MTLSIQFPNIYPANKRFLIELRVKIAKILLGDLPFITNIEIEFDEELSDLNLIIDGLWADSCKLNGRSQMGKNTVSIKPWNIAEIKNAIPNQ